MDQRIKDLRAQGDKLFNHRAPLLSRWQDQAEHFYPERGDFLYQRSLGYEFASNLTTSYPLLVRRELANAFSYMLRPPGKKWFSLATDPDGNEADVAGRAWLEDKAAVMRRAMNDRVSNFNTAVIQGDNDFAAFGQTVISLELGPNADTLLYKCHHLRDVVWATGNDESICEVHRNWKPAARVLNKVFKGKVDPKVSEILFKEPHREIACRHIVIASEYYDGPTKFKTPYVSITIDCENDFLLEEKGIYNRFYIIPRWLTVSGSQYAHSPAMVAALPEARTLQAMNLTLLEAGQKSVDPPMLATIDSIRGDMNLFAGGITHVDAEYDQKLGDALRPLTIDRGGMSYGAELIEKSRQIISDCFYLNKISLPPQNGAATMTATEVNERMNEYIRNALPLFQPMEIEYNGALCEETFNLMFRNGAFGPVEQIPPSLSGQQIHFRFQSPIQQSEEAAKGQIFQQAQGLLAQAAQLDQTVLQMVDPHKAARDALTGIAVPADWMRTEEQMQAIQVQAAQEQQAQKALQNVGQAAQVAEQVGNAGQALQGLAAGQTAGARTSPMGVLQKPPG
jgi:hypothetical protein